MRSFQWSQFVTEHGVLVLLQGVLEKHSVTEVPLIITPQRLEETEITSHFVIFGNPRMPLVGDKHPGNTDCAMSEQ